jgi:hypothetical protein
VALGSLQESGADLRGETMGSSKVLESRGGHFRRTGVFLVAILLLLLQPGAAVPGGSESTHGRNVSDWKIESVLEQRRDAQPWQVWAGPFAGKHWGIGDGGGRCEESYGVVPCSKSLGGNVLLLVAFGFVLYKSAMLMSDGSDLLLTVTDPGIVGGLVLPILGALPDAWLIVGERLQPVLVCSISRLVVVEPGDSDDGNNYFMIDDGGGYLGLLQCRGWEEVRLKRRSRCLWEWGCWLDQSL